MGLKSASDYNSIVYYQMVACANRLVTTHPARLGCLIRKKDRLLLRGFWKDLEYCLQTRGLRSEVTTITLALHHKLTVL